MNRIALIALGCLIATALLAVGATSMPGTTAAQPAVPDKHRIVFEVTAEGQEQWEAVLNNVENVRVSLGPATQVEVVMHGKALGMVMATNTGQLDRMRKLSDAGVVFAACENTMKRKNVSKDQLLPFAVTVDSGVAEVVRKQEKGWSYIKSGS